MNYFVSAIVPVKGGQMKLQRKEREFLATFVAIADKLLGQREARRGNGVRQRRSGHDLERLKRRVIAARKRNIPVRQIAEDYGITPSYIYQITRT
jgi:hypothetical protein